VPSSPPGKEQWTTRVTASVAPHTESPHEKQYENHEINPEKLK